MHTHDGADRVLRLGDRSIAQLARPTALADPLAGWTGRPVGRADLGVAFQPDDIVEAQLGEEVRDAAAVQPAVAASAITVSVDSTYIVSVAGGRHCVAARYARG